jgi:hypothetical protein
LGERKTSGKLHSVERAPSENPVNIKNQWKIPGLGMGTLIQNAMPDSTSQTG